MFDLKFHQILVKIDQNPKFLVFSLILSRISPLSFQKSKSLRLCVVKFFWIYFWEVYFIIYLRKIISYFLNAWLWKNSLFKSSGLIWNFIKFLQKSIKISNFLLFCWISLPQLWVSKFQRGYVWFLRWAYCHKAQMFLYRMVFFDTCSKIPKSQTGRQSPCKQG